MQLSRAKQVSRPRLAATANGLVAAWLEPYSGGDPGHPALRIVGLDPTGRPAGEPWTWGEEGEFCHGPFLAAHGEGFLLARVSGFASFRLEALPLGAGGEPRGACQVLSEGQTTWVPGAMLAASGESLAVAWSQYEQDHGYRVLWRRVLPHGAPGRVVDLAGRECESAQVLSVAAAASAHDVWWAERAGGSGGQTLWHSRLGEGDELACCQEVRLPRPGRLVGGTAFAHQPVLAWVAEGEDIGQELRLLGLDDAGKPDGNDLATELTAVQVKEIAILPRDEGMAVLWTACSSLGAPPRLLLSELDLNGRRCGKDLVLSAVGRAAFDVAAAVCGETLAAVWVEVPATGPERTGSVQLQVFPDL